MNSTWDPREHTECPNCEISVDNGIRDKDTCGEAFVRDLFWGQRARAFVVLVPRPTVGGMFRFRLGRDRVIVCAKSHDVIHALIFA